jgi:hypothetical protein
MGLDQGDETRQAAWALGHTSLLANDSYIVNLTFPNPGTVLLKSIRQSRVTGVLDVTNFATLSRVTEALDELLTNILFVTVG